MSRELIYPNAPIVEALLDLQVQLPAATVVGGLEECYAAVREAYPKKTALHEAQGTIEFGPRVSASATSRALGYAFESADAKQVFQARITGFTANRLAPYTGWDVFSSEALRLWEVYRTVANPERVTGLSLRYINRIDIPTSPVEIKDYLRTVPEVASGLPQQLQNFFFQVSLPVTELKAVATITETPAASFREGGVSILFDLELYRTEDLPTDIEGLTKILREFRVRKNEIFELCITNKTRELFR